MSMSDNSRNSSDDDETEESVVDSEEEKKPQDEEEETKSQDEEESSSSEEETKSQDAEESSSEEEETKSQDEEDSSEEETNSQDAEEEKKPQDEEESSSSDDDESTASKSDDGESTTSNSDEEEKKKSPAAKRAVDDDNSDEEELFTKETIEKPKPRVPCFPGKPCMVRMIDNHNQHPAPVDCIRFSGDGKFAASASRDGMVKVYNVSALECVSTSISILPSKIGNEKVAKLRKRFVSSLALSHDGSCLASSCPVNEPVKIWDTISGCGIPICDVLMPQVFVADIDAGELRTICDKQYVRCYNMHTGDFTRHWSSTNSDMTALVTATFSKTRVCTVDKLHRMRIDSTGKNLAEAKDVACAAIAPSGEHVAMSTKDGLFLTKVNNLDARHRMSTDSARSVVLTDRHLAAAFADHVKVFDLHSAHVSTIPGVASALALSHTHLAIGFGDGTVILKHLSRLATAEQHAGKLNIRLDAQLVRVEPNSVTGPGMTVTVAQNGGTIEAKTSDGTTPWKATPLFPFKHVFVSKNGSLMVGLADKHVGWWLADIGYGMLIEVECLDHAALSDDGNTVLFEAANSEYFLWTFGQGQPIKKITESGHCGEIKYESGKFVITLDGNPKQLNPQNGEFIVATSTNAGHRGASLVHVDRSTDWSQLGPAIVQMKLCGGQLVTMNKDAELCKWTKNACTQIARFQSTHLPSHFAISCDGTVLAFVSSLGVTVCRENKCQPISIEHCHPIDAAVSSNGKFVAVVCGNGSVMWWSVRKNKVIRKFESAVTKPKVVSLQIDSEDRFVQLWTVDGYRYTWNVASGKLEGKPWRGAIGKQVVCSSDLERAATYTGMEILLSNRDGSETTRLPVYNNEITRMAMSDDGHELVCTDGSCVFGWNLTTKKKFGPFKSEAFINDVAVHGKMVLLGLADGSIHHLQSNNPLATGPPKRKFLGESPDVVRKRLHFYPARFDDIEEQGESVADIQQVAKRIDSPSEKLGVEFVAYSGDSRCLFVSHGDGIVSKDNQHWQLICDNISDLRVSRTGQWVAAVCPKCVVVWDTTTSSGNGFKLDSHDVGNCAISDDGQTVVLSLVGQSTLLQVFKSGALFRVMRTQAAGETDFVHAGVNADGTAVTGFSLMGADDEMVKFIEYRPATNDMKFAFVSAIACGDTVLDVSGNGLCIAACDEKENVRVERLGSSPFVAAWHAPDILSATMPTLNFDGTRLAFCPTPKECVVVNTATGVAVLATQTFKADVSELAFSPDGKELAVVVESKKIKRIRLIVTGPKRRLESDIRYENDKETRDRLDLNIISTTEANVVIPAGYSYRSVIPVDEDEDEPATNPWWLTPGPRNSSSFADDVYMSVERKPKASSSSSADIHVDLTTSDDDAAAPRKRIAAELPLPPELMHNRVPDYFFPVFRPRDSNDSIYDDERAMFVEAVYSFIRSNDTYRNILCSTRWGTVLLNRDLKLVRGMVEIRDREGIGYNTSCKSVLIQNRVFAVTTSYKPFFWDVSSGLGYAIETNRHYLKLLCANYELGAYEAYTDSRDRVTVHIFRWDDPKRGPLMSVDFVGQYVQSAKFVGNKLIALTGTGCFSWEIDSLEEPVRLFRWDDGAPANARDVRCLTISANDDDMSVAVVYRTHDNNRYMLRVFPDCTAPHGGRAWTHVLNNSDLVDEIIVSGHGDQIAWISHRILYVVSNNDTKNVVRIKGKDSVGPIAYHPDENSVLYLLNDKTMKLAKVPTTSFKNTVTSLVSSGFYTRDDSLSHPFTRFLTEGLYDPRLLLFVYDFADMSLQRPAESKKDPNYRRDTFTSETSVKPRLVNSAGASSSKTPVKPQLVNFVGNPALLNQLLGLMTRDRRVQIKCNSVEELCEEPIMENEPVIPTFDDNKCRLMAPIVLQYDPALSSDEMKVVVSFFSPTELISAIEADKTIRKGVMALLHVNLVRKTHLTADDISDLIPTSCKKNGWPNGFTFFCTSAAEFHDRLKQFACKKLQMENGEPVDADTVMTDPWSLVDEIRVYLRSPILKRLPAVVYSVTKRKRLLDRCIGFVFSGNFYDLNVKRVYATLASALIEHKPSLIVWSNSNVNDKRKFKRSLIEYCRDYDLADVSNEIRNITMSVDLEKESDVDRIGTYIVKMDGVEVEAVDTQKAESDFKYTRCVEPAEIKYDEMSRRFGGNQPLISCLIASQNKEFLFACVSGTVLVFDRQFKLRKSQRLLGNIPIHTVSPSMDGTCLVGITSEQECWWWNVETGEGFQCRIGTNRARVFNHVCTSNDYVACHLDNRNFFAIWDTSTGKLVNKIKWDEKTTVYDMKINETASSDPVLVVASDRKCYTVDIRADSDELHTAVTYSNAKCVRIAADVRTLATLGSNGRLAIFANLFVDDDPVWNPLSNGASKVIASPNGDVVAAYDIANGVIYSGRDDHRTHMFGGFDQRVAAWQLVEFFPDSGTLVIGTTDQLRLEETKADGEEVEPPRLARQRNQFGGALDPNLRRELEEEHANAPDDNEMFRAQRGFFAGE